MILRLIRGLPGSGKSTLAKQMVKEEGFVHFEADMFFMQNGEYEFVPGLIKQAHYWCQHQTECAIKEGKDVVVSNTFTQLWEMEPYLEMAGPRNKVEIYHCTGQWGNIHNVPEETIQRMKERFQETSAVWWERSRTICKE